MLTRREALGTIAAGALLGKASQPSTAVDFAVPADACDCHTHIIGDPKKFPFWSGRLYTPEPALPKEMSALHRALHMERVVIVNPSIYGTDNSSTLYGMKARGKTARGIAVIDDHTSEGELDAMGRAGIRGIRINAVDANASDAAASAQRFRAAVQRMKARNWHIQMYLRLPAITGMKEMVHASEVPVVFDHFGGAVASLGVNQPGFADLIELVRSGKAYVKISGAYRVSTKPDYEDVAPLAKALIAANADRILWGSDWPHPDSLLLGGHKADEVSPMLQIDDGRLLNLFAVWAPDAATRKKILVDNPARLYGF